VAEQVRKRTDVGSDEPEEMIEPEPEEAEAEAAFASSAAEGGAPESAAAEGQPPEEAAESETPAGEAQPELQAGAHEHLLEDERDEETGDEPADDEELVEEQVVVVRRGAFITGVAVAALLIIGLGAFAAYEEWFKPVPAVATVNGVSISRKDYDAAVAKGDGKQILDGLVSKVLVEQAARQNHVTVTDDEINAKLQQTKSQFASDAEYQQELQSQNLTEADLRSDIRLELLLEKLSASKPQVSEQDIQNYYDQNKEQFQGKSLDDVRSQIQQTLTQQQQDNAAQAYLDQLRSKAKIVEHLPGA